MNCISGKVHISKANHHTAYCAQQPCKHFSEENDESRFQLCSGLEHATIRDNIIYGSTYDAVRYHDVIDACALERDLDVFDAGDRTGKMQLF